MKTFTKTTLLANQATSISQKLISSGIDYHFSINKPKFVFSVPMKNAKQLNSIIKETTRKNKIPIPNEWSSDKWIDLLLPIVQNN